METSRRAVLRGIGIGGLTGLAGCLTDDTTTRAVSTSTFEGWEMARGGSGNRSYVPVSSAGNGASERWEFSPSTGDGIELQPSVARERVFVTADRTYAIDRSNGEPVWEFSDGGDSYRFRIPVLDGDAAYIAHRSREHGNLTAVDRSDGTERWSTETTESFWASPTLEDGALYVPFNAHYRGYGNDNYVTRLGRIDTEDGVEQWTFDVDDPSGGGFSIPATSETAVFASLDGTLYSVSKSNGRERWSTAVSRYEAPSVSDGRVYVPVRDGLRVLDAEDGSQVWQRPVRGVPEIAVGAESAYVGHSEGVSSFATESGERRWETDLATAVRPTVTNDSVYLADERTLYELSTSDGSVRWEADLGDEAIGQPVFDGERLYVTTRESVVCYDVE